MTARADQPLYCPFDLVDDPGAFELVPHADLRTAFGSTYVVASEPSQDTVKVFLHGVGSSWTAWTPLLQQAARDDARLGDVLLLDLPGFGRSENELGHLHAELVGSEVIAVARELGWSSIELVGHSMGGFLALDMASRGHVEIVDVSVISGAYFSIIDTVRHLTSAREAWRSVLRGRPAARPYAAMTALAAAGPLATPLLRILHRTGTLPYLLTATAAHPHLLRDSVLDAIAENLRPAAFQLAARNGDGYDAAARWAEIGVPLRALFGRDDELVPPADAGRLEACRPGVRTEIVDGVAHFCPLERPDLALAFLLG